MIGCSINLISIVFLVYFCFPLFYHVSINLFCLILQYPKNFIFIFISGDRRIAEEQRSAEEELSERDNLELGLINGTHITGHL